MFRFCVDLLKFEDQREVVAVERILQVVYIDPQRASPVSLYLNQLLYEWM